MARAAGNDSHYVWRLKGREGQCDIRLPSVTSIIKAVMAPSMGGMAWWGAKLALEWAGGDYEAYKKSDKNPNAARDKAGDRGNAAHEYLEALVEYTNEAPEPTTPYEQAVQSWWNDNMPGWEVIGCEEPVYSLRHGYAGTVDLVRRHIGTGKIEVMDLKTHKGAARFEDHAQVAAYDLALREMGVIPEGAEHAVLLAREDGTYEVSNRWVNPEIFLKLRDVYEEVSK
jgi:hypothetical protein